MELYSGELLPEDRYEEWTEDRREELRRSYLDLSAELAGLYEERAEFERAIELLRRVADEEPTSEEAHIGLMRLYLETRERHRAVRQYELLRKALEEELGTEPGGTARRLYEEMRAGRSYTMPPPSAVVRPPAKLSSPPPHNLPNPLTADAQKVIGRVERH